MMKNVDFSTRPDGEVEVREGSKAPYILDATHRGMISNIFDNIRLKYPDAYKALCEAYSNSSRNKSWFEFLCVRRFIKCNWSLYDNISDIDSQGNFHFEFCQCPLRGECKHWKIICEPKPNSKLSPTELNVLRLISKGLQNEEIADILHISVHTVHNHRNSILRKTGLHNSAALTDYYHRNNFK